MIAISVGGAVGIVVALVILGWCYAWLVKKYYQARYKIGHQ